MRYILVVTNKCKKDIIKAKKQGKNLDEFYCVVEKLQCGKKLDSKYKDHVLVGEYIGYRECHIKPDFLLIYKIIENELILELLRVGSHSELFS